MEIENTNLIVFDKNTEIIHPEENFTTSDMVMNALEWISVLLVTADLNNLSDDSNIQNVIDNHSMLKKLAKDINDKRIDAFRPSGKIEKELKVQIDDKILKPINDKIKVLHDKIKAYEKEQEALRRAAQQKKLEELRNAAKQKTPTPAPRTPTSAPVPVKIRKQLRWVGDVINPKIVPEEYWFDNPVDPAKITKAIAAGTREIPGVKIHQKEILL